MINPYYSKWKDNESIIKDFEAPNDALNEATVLFAAYEGASYEGDATVIFQKDNKLFQVSGGHCSCYGLEGQWRPIEIDPKQLVKTELSNYSYSDETRNAYNQLILLLNPEGDA